MKARALLVAIIISLMVAFLPIYQTVAFADGGCFISPIPGMAKPDGVPFGGNTGFEPFHTGVDYVGYGANRSYIYIGAPVVAPADGRVVWVGDFGNPKWENTVIIKTTCNGKDAWVMLEHIDSLVQPGDDVVKGQQVAKIAPCGTGYCSAPHLHTGLSWADLEAIGRGRQAYSIGIWDDFTKYVGGVISEPLSQSDEIKVYPASPATALSRTSQIGLMVFGSLALLVVLAVVLFFFKPNAMLDVVDIVEDWKKKGLIRRSLEGASKVIFWLVLTACVLVLTINTRSREWLSYWLQQQSTVSNTAILLVPVLSFLAIWWMKRKPLYLTVPSRFRGFANFAGRIALASAIVWLTAVWVSSQAPQWTLDLSDKLSEMIYESLTNDTPEVFKELMESHTTELKSWVFESLASFWSGIVSGVFEAVQTAAGSVLLVFGPVYLILIGLQFQEEQGQKKLVVSEKQPNLFLQTLLFLMLITAMVMSTGFTLYQAKSYVSTPLSGPIVDTAPSDMMELPASYVTDVRRLAPQVIQIAREEDVPPEVIFVLKLKESGIRWINPGNGEGLCGFYDMVTVSGQNYFTPGPLSDSQILEQLRLCAKEFKRRYPEVVYTTTDMDLLGNAYMRYNGNLDCYYNPFPSWRQHPYVMNGYDKLHMRMEARSGQGIGICVNLQIIGAIPAHIRVGEILREVSP